MTNPYYNHTSGQPISSTLGRAAAIRTELDAIATGFETVPVVSPTAWVVQVVGTTTDGICDYLSGRSGLYVKLGRLVMFTGEVSWANHTGTGDMKIRGLPGLKFPQSIVPQVAITVYNRGTPTAKDLLSAYVGYGISPTETAIFFAQQDVKGITSIALPLPVAGSVAFSGFYFATA